MKCPNCGTILSDDNKFCRFCGAKLDLTTCNEPAPEDVSSPNESLAEVDAPIATDVPSQPDSTSVAPSLSSKKKTVYCKRCGGPIDPEEKRCTLCGKKYSLWKKVLPICILIFLLFVSFGANFGQFFFHKVALSEVESTLDTKLDKIDQQNEEIRILEASLASRNDELTRLQDSLSSYEDSFALLSQGNVGYAASNFNVDQSVIVLRQNQTKKFTLTANWSDGGTVSVDYSNGLIADISFDNDSWYTSTQMTAEGYSPGSTVVTFSNDVDSRTFKMLIIVTE